jgi:hypothetical protein
VLFCVYVNDLLDNIHHPLYTIRDDALVPLDPRRDYLYRLGVILGRVPSALQDLRLVRFVTSRLASSSARKPKRDIEMDDPIQWAKRKFQLQVRALRVMASEDGFGLVVVGVPHKDGKPMYAWVSELDLHGVPFLNMSALPAWRQKTDGLFFETDYHLTPEGNRQVALSLSRYLRDGNLAEPMLGSVEPSR